MEEQKGRDLFANINYYYCLGYKAKLPLLSIDKTLLDCLAYENLLLAEACLQRE